jgi:6-pyruvoyltetrahydropterin/6-carboxytetrahydropterin synthase
VAVAVAAGGVAVAAAAAAVAARRRRPDRVTHHLVLAREQFKFSCAHMTVFADGTKERLHGHNYTIAVELEVERVDLAAMIPFAPIKAAIAELCAAWKERVLLAATNPFFKILRDDTELEFTLCGERYVMPRHDALLLPIDNISVEALAAHVAELLRPQISARTLCVTVSESPGQGARCSLSL